LLYKYIIFLSFISFSVNADQLRTSSYEIEIGSCPEGYVSCDTIPINVKELNTGIVTAYTGETLHTLCADGETPCRFLGYQFTGDVGQFYIYENSTLEIKDDSNQTILVEEGSWFE
jgi:hypothetical protein